MAELKIKASAVECEILSRRLRAAEEASALADEAFALFCIARKIRKAKLVRVGVDAVVVGLSDDGAA